MFLIMLMFTTSVAESPELLPIDAVLVLDVSRSMITADPNRIANKAMNMFIDKLEVGRDQVGVVAYAGHVTHSRDLALLCEKEVAYLYELIGNLEYASWTDHPLGLLESIRILYEGTGYGRQPVIIFLTDGNLNVSPHIARTTAQAEEDKIVAIELAQEHGIPIYSIGLNFDGQLDRKYIDVVAEETGGLSFETANAEDLPDILAQIFSLMIHAQQPPEPIPPLLPQTESYYISQEPAYTPLEETTQSHRRWIFLSAAIVLFVVAILYRRKQKRVFTGRLVIESTSDPTQYRNLVEYGSRVTLQQLLGRQCPFLASVVLVPSPYTPSHLPQLLVKCKNKNIKFTKNFTEQDAQKGIAVGTGTEVMAVYEAEQVKLRYIV